MTLQQFSLSWEKHQSNICNGFRDFQLNGDFVDMTLAAEGHHVKVHKMMMGVASTYFRSLISTADTKHPIVFLHNISYETLLSLLEFIYTGEVAVQEDKLVDFINTAQKLQISGLLDMNEQGYQSSKPVGELSPKDPSGSDHKKVIDSLFLEQVGGDHNVEAADTSKSVLFAIDPLGSAGRVSDLNQHKPLNAIDPLGSAGRVSDLNQHKPLNTQEVVSPAKPIFVKTAQGRLIRRVTNLKTSSSGGDDQKPLSFQEILRRTSRKRSASPVSGRNEKRALSPITTVDEIDEDADDDTASDKVQPELSNLEKLKVQGLQYTLSNRGAYQLILNRFVYNLYNKTRTDAYRWRCVEYRDNRCLACVITDGGVIVRRMNMHNHVFHDKRILKKMQKNLVYKNLDELDEVKKQLDSIKPNKKENSKEMTE